MTNRANVTATGRYTVTFSKPDLQVAVDNSPGDSVPLAFDIGESMSGYNNRHHQFEYQYNHRFGFHLNGMVPGAVQECIALKPPVIKVLDPNVDTLRQFRQNRSDAIIIYRQFFGQPLGGTESEAYNIGRSQASIVLRAEAVQQGLVDLIEGYNERLPESAPEWEHRLYNKFMVGFYDECQTAGFPARPMAFNFATGNGSSEMFLNYYRETLEKYEWLGFHEYDWPVMDRLHQQGLADGNGGKWLALRYQRIMEPVVAEMGDNWSYIITETGMTQGVLGGDDLGPWASVNTVTQSPWDGVAVPITADDYWTTLNWYNNEIMKDPHVAGVCLFVTGATGDPKWPTFEHVPAITSRILDNQAIIDSEPSPPDPPDPPPNGGDMKTQVYIQQAPGEFVGMNVDLPTGSTVAFQAVADSQSGKEFSHWTDHTGGRHDNNPLQVTAGSSLSMMAHFRDKDPDPGDEFPPAWWPFDRPLVGLHGRNDYHWHGPDYQMVSEANIETATFMGHTDIQSFISFNQQFPGVPINVRIYSVQMQNEYFDQGRRPNPDVYVGAVRGAIAQQSQYARVFRIHNEPNHLHEYEGWGSSDEDANDFNGWFIAVLGLLRREFPDLKFLFPNLAQGGAHNDLSWFTRCLPAVEQADGYGASCYWQNPNGNEGRHLSEDWGLRFVKYDDIASDAGITRPIFIAEAGNSNHHTAGWPAASEQQVADEITQYYQHIMENYRGVVYAVMPFLMSSPGGWQAFSWREENGRFKQVVGAVGSMQRPPLDESG